MSKYYKAAGIQQIPAENANAYLAAIRTPLFDFYTTKKIEMEVSFPAVENKSYTSSLLYAFYYYCHVGYHCTLAAMRAFAYPNGKIYLQLNYPVARQSAPTIMQDWQYATTMGAPYTPDTKMKITGTYDKTTKIYNIILDTETGQYNSSDSGNEERTFPGVAHSGYDHTTEEYLHEACSASIGDASFNWSAPGGYTLKDIGYEKYDPFTIYSFKAWNDDGTLVTDLRPMAITDDNGSNPRGGMYDALTDKIYEAMRRSNFGNSKFEPIDPDYSQELFPETPARFFLGEQMPGEIYLGKDKIKSVKYGAKTVWGGCLK